jgi:putative DNA primase/helicase
MEITWKPNGNNAIITLKNGQETGWVDIVPVLKDEKRTEYLDRALEHFPGIDRHELEQALDRIACVLAAAPAARDAEPRGDPKDIILDPPEPWPEPVDGAELLDAIAALFRQYMILPQYGDVVLALFVVYAHAFDHFDVSPLLVLTSPTKRCGKTRVIGLLAELCPKALSTANVSAAALFRVIEKLKPTVLIDEAETLFAKRSDPASEERRGVLNSGHDRNSACVIRCVGDKQEPQTFSTWCPKVAALIGRLPDTLEDRAIVVRLRRKASQEVVERLRMDRTRPMLWELRRKSARWALDHAEALREADPELPPLGSDRAEDNWRILTAIADVAGGHWPVLARKVAATSARVESDSDSLPEQLLVDVRMIFASKGVNRLSSRALCDALAELEERPWNECNYGKPITLNGLARLLKGFEVRPRTIKLADGGSAKGYHLADFNDCFSRYVGLSPSQTVTADTIPELKGNSEGTTVTKNDSFSPTVTRQCIEVQGDLLKGHGVTVANERKDEKQKKIHVVDVAEPIPSDMEVFYEGR